MLCKGCGNKEAFSSKTTYHKDGSKSMECDKCGNVRVYIPYDVSPVHKPYFDENLCTKENPKGTYITSRMHKKRVLDSLGLREKSESKWKFISDPVKRQKYFRDQIGE